MDEKARGPGQPQTSIEETLSPESKRLIEIQIELGKMRTAQYYINLFYQHVESHKLSVDKKIQSLEEERDNLRQGQLIL